MSTRSTALGRHTSAGGSSNGSFGAIPAGETWLVKSVKVHNGGVGSLTIAVFVTSADGLTSVYFVNQSVAQGADVEWNGWLAAVPGDAVRYQLGGDGVNVWVSGAKLPQVV
jgi:hypothetical protein